MTRRLLLPTVAAVCLLASLVGPARATIGEPREGLPPGIGIRLLDVPVDRADDPRSNLYVVDHTLPGGGVSRRVLVSNGTDEPLPVEMIAVESRIEDGWVSGTDPSDNPASISSWVEMSPSSFTLAPQSTTEVDVQISVPAGTPPGERYGSIIAQPPATEGENVDLVSRVGVRVYLSVGGDEPETDFQIDTLTASRTEEGEPSVDVGVLNTGGRAIDVSGELELEDESGTVTAGPFSTALPRTLAPQSRGQVTVPLPESLASGPWKVTATMRSGLVERVAETTITFPDEPGTRADPAESDTIGGTDEDGNDISERLRGQRRALLPLAAVMVLLALGALWLMLMWKRRDDEEEDDDELAATTAAGAGAEDST